mmetsp:Transcript_44639/g.142133  ORF Transcript_44639/g.142133 Transcript_44639/m.142133 type:complete len:448 (-) Transcript_44639:73-1416(-)
MSLDAALLRDPTLPLVVPLRALSPPDREGEAEADMDAEALLLGTTFFFFFSVSTPPAASARRAEASLWESLEALARGLRYLLSSATASWICEVLSRFSRTSACRCRKWPLRSRTSSSCLVLPPPSLRPPSLRAASRSSSPSDSLSAAATVWRTTPSISVLSPPDSLASGVAVAAPSVAAPPPSLPPPLPPPSFFSPRKCLMSWRSVAKAPIRCSTKPTRRSAGPFPAAPSLPPPMRSRVSRKEWFMVSSIWMHSTLRWSSSLLAACSATSSTALASRADSDITFCSAMATRCSRAPSKAPICPSVSLKRASTISSTAPWAMLATRESNRSESLSTRAASLSSCSADQARNLASSTERSRLETTPLPLLSSPYRVSQSTSSTFFTRALTVWKARLNAPSCSSEKVWVHLTKRATFSSFSSMRAEDVAFCSMRSLKVEAVRQADDTLSS